MLRGVISMKLLNTFTPGFVAVGIWMVLLVQKQSPCAWQDL